MKKTREANKTTTVDMDIIISMTMRAKTIKTRITIIIIVITNTTKNKERSIKITMVELHSHTIMINMIGVIINSKITVTKIISRIIAKNVSIVITISPQILMLKIML